MAIDVDTQDTQKKDQKMIVAPGQVCEQPEMARAPTQVVRDAPTVPTRADLQAVGQLINHLTAGAAAEFGRQRAFGFHTAEVIGELREKTQEAYNLHHGAIQQIWDATIAHQKALETIRNWGQTKEKSEQEIASAIKKNAEKIKEIEEYLQNSQVHVLQEITKLRSDFESSHRRLCEDMYHTNLGIEEISARLLVIEQAPDGYVRAQDRIQGEIDAVKQLLNPEGLMQIQAQLREAQNLTAQLTASVDTAKQAWQPQNISQQLEGLIANKTQEQVAAHFQKIQQEYLLNTQIELKKMLENYRQDCMEIQHQAITQVRLQLAMDATNQGQTFAQHAQNYMESCIGDLEKKCWR